MASSIQVSSSLSSFSSSSSHRSSKRITKPTIHVPRAILVAPKPSPKPSRKLFQELNGFTHTITNIPTIQNNNSFKSTTSNKAIQQLYAILEALADRIEMHHNVGEQRDNWNNLLLNSINMITLTAVAMSGIAATSGADMSAPLLALKISSSLLFSASTGMLIIINKIQPSQLAEEQRNATRLFKQLKSHIETTLAIGNPTEKDVKDAMEKVLALDKAYPLPLLGAMIEKFPKKFEPAVWWPSKSKSEFRETERNGKKNGWNEGLEREIQQVLEVVKRKDMEDYERLGNLALKVNKSLAIAGPLLTGIAAVGSAFVSQGSWTALVPVMAGALGTAVNAFEHGGQVGMVFEMYRNSGGFFQLLENTIRETMEEEDAEQRENGELFEMKLALKLGRSLSQLRDLARKSAYSSVEGTATDEFASKLF